MAAAAFKLVDAPRRGVRRGTAADGEAEEKGLLELMRERRDAMAAAAAAVLALRALVGLEDEDPVTGLPKLLLPPPLPAPVRPNGEDPACAVLSRRVLVVTGLVMCAAEGEGSARTGATALRSGWGMISIADAGRAMGREETA